MKSTDQKPILGYIPRCLLRGVEPSKVKAMYENGSYSHLTLEMLRNHARKSKLPELFSSIPAINSSSITTTDSNSDLFVYRDRYNNSHVVATTNCFNYQIYTETGHLPSEGGICKQCLKPYKSIALGIPIRLIEISYPLINLNTEPKEKEKEALKKENSSEALKKEKESNLTLRSVGRENCKVYFMADCSYCSFECVLSVIRDNNSSSLYSRNPHYMDSEQQLKSLFFEMYPHVPTLYEANDPSLRKESGGSLDDPSFRAHCYQPTYNIICPPVKYCHFRIDSSLDITKK